MSFQRYKFKEYALHGNEKGSPALGVDGFPIMLDMNAVRKVVKYDEKSKKILRDISQSALWDGVVKAAAEGYASTPVCALFLIRKKNMFAHLYLPWSAVFADDLGELHRTRKTQYLSLDCLGPTRFPAPRLRRILHRRHRRFRLLEQVLPARTEERAFLARGGGDLAERQDGGGGEDGYVLAMEWAHGNQRSDGCKICISEGDGRVHVDFEKLGGRCVSLTFGDSRWYYPLNCFRC